MILLKYSLSDTKYDILGLSEIRRKGNEIIEDEDHIFCYTGKVQGQHGVGFLIKKKYKNNITSYIGISSRVCILIMKFDTVSISIIQVYAPTSDAPDEELDIFYNQIEEALKIASGIIILMGDFNAKIGQKKPSEHSNSIMGAYCYGERNERGEKLLQFALTNQFTIINTIFKKNIKNLWTWTSPDHQYRNQIDYIMSNDAKLVSNMEILNNKTFPSDHRLLRATIHLRKQKKCRASFRGVQTDLSSDVNQQVYLENLLEKTNQIQWENIENVESFYIKIEKAIKESLACLTLIKARKTIISEETKQQLKKRIALQLKPSKNKEEKKELSNLYKDTNKMLKKDYEDYRMDIIKKHLTTSGSQKKAYKQLNSEKRWIPTLNSQNTPKTQTRENLINIASSFYRKLYQRESSDENVYKKCETQSITPIEPFDCSEIMKKIEKLKNEKSPGPDNIPNEALKVGKKILIGFITILFNKILDTQEIPKKWGESRIILLYKKGDPSDINNYRPINLLPCMYKLFAMCMEKRIEQNIEINQPVEQAGFRPGYSTIDHIHTLDQIVEKHLEFNQPLYLGYIDYAKAFDSISHESIWQALVHQGVSTVYINIIKDIYQKSVSRVKLDRLGPIIYIRKGVKQGDPMSPKIFIAVLQNVMRSLDWSRKGIPVGAEYLSNLRFADDIVLFASTSKQLETMLVEINRASQAIGLQLNTLKTKVATNSYQNPITVGEASIEYVNEYIYLGKQISFKKTRHEEEVERRINITWKKYWSLKEILKSKFPLKLKKKVIDSSLLPCLSYGAQTWIYTLKIRKKIRSFQRAVERSILGIKLRDKQKSEGIRRKTKIIDAVQYMQSLKWKWAGHVARTTDNRWTKRVTKWKGPSGKRRSGKPKDRWVDDINKIAGKEWIQMAQDRKVWKNLEEAYTQKGAMS